MVTGTSRGKLVPRHTAQGGSPWPHFPVWGSVELLDTPLCAHFAFLIKAEQLVGACSSLIFVLWKVNAGVKSEAFHFSSVRTAARASFGLTVFPVVNITSLYFVGRKSQISCVCMYIFTQDDFAHF